jgi:hypothetical protein
MQPVPWPVCGMCLRYQFADDRDADAYQWPLGALIGIDTHNLALIFPNLAPWRMICSPSLFRPRGENAGILNGASLSLILPRCQLNLKCGLNGWGSPRYSFWIQLG